MSNKLKLKKQKSRTRPSSLFQDLEDREYHAVQALSMAGQKTVQCKYCEGPNPITLETILDGDSTIIGVIWRICSDHGLEAVCADCVKKHLPEMIS
jgi:hypothetical protein